MTMTKRDLIQSVQNETQFSKKQSTEIVESVIEYISSSLEKGADVLILGFQKFQVKEKNTRKGWNPATGEPMILPERKVVSFRGGLKDRMNG